jgi:hypothetical protein
VIERTRPKLRTLDAPDQLLSDAGSRGVLAGANTLLHVHG